MVPLSIAMYNSYLWSINKNDKYWKKILTVVASIANKMYLKPMLILYPTNNKETQYPRNEEKFH